jgi:hypothetical protein
VFARLIAIMPDSINIALKIRLHLLVLGDIGYQGVQPPAQGELFPLFRVGSEILIHNRKLLFQMALDFAR